MNMAGELLAHGLLQDRAQLDEKLYLEVFQPNQPRPLTAAKKKARI